MRATGLKLSVAVGHTKSNSILKNRLNRLTETEIISEIQLKHKLYQKVAIHSYKL